MKYKLTNSGIVALTEGKYSNRYNSLANYDILANGNIERKKKVKKIAAKKRPIAKKHFDFNASSEQPTEVNEIQLPAMEKSRSLKGKAALIKNRIVSKINSLEGSPKMSFVTITFPALTDDKICYRLLNTWLTIVRQKTSKFSYLWVAERQQNTTIHFHLCTTNYIPIKQYNQYMKNAIKDLIGKGLINWSQSAATGYNGIDIAKDRKTKRITNFADKKKGRQLIQYLTKYVTKNNTTSKHSLWSCSSDYSNLVIAIHCTKKELVYFLKNVPVNLTAIRQFEYFTFIPWLDGCPQKLLDHITFANRLINFSQLQP